MWKKFTTHGKLLSWKPLCTTRAKQLLTCVEPVSTTSVWHAPNTGKVIWIICMGYAITLVGRTRVYKHKPVEDAVLTHGNKLHTIPLWRRKNYVHSNRIHGLGYHKVSIKLKWGKNAGRFNSSATQKKGKWSTLYTIVRYFGTRQSIHSSWL